MKFKIRGGNGEPDGRLYMEQDLKTIVIPTNCIDSLAEAIRRHSGSEGDGYGWEIHESDVRFGTPGGMVRQDHFEYSKSKCSNCGHRVKCDINADLYEALEKLLKFAKEEMDIPHWDWFKGIEEQAETALAKARGE